MYDSKSKNSSSRSQRPESARYGPEARQRDCAFVRPIQREDIQLRGDIMESVDDDSAADERKRLDRIATGGNDVAPIRRCRMIRIDLDDASSGRVEVGLRDQAVAREGCEDVGVHASHDRVDRRLWIEALRVNLAAGPPMRDAEQQVLPVLRHGRANPVADAKPLAEDIAVLRQRSPDRMVANADSRRAILSRVEKAAAIRAQRHAAIERAWKTVGQVFASHHIARAQLRLVFAAGAYAVDEKSAVERDVFDSHARGVVGAQRVGIEQHGVRTREPLAHEETRQIVASLAAQRKVTAAALGGSPLSVLTTQYGQSLANSAEGGQRIEQRVRVGVLCVDECTCLGRLLVLEPSIRIDQLDPVQRLLDIVAPRPRRIRHSRRRWCSLLRVRITGATESQREQDGRQPGQSRHIVSASRRRRRTRAISASKRARSTTARPSLDEARERIVHCIAHRNSVLDRHCSPPVTAEARLQISRHSLTSSSPRYLRSPAAHSPAALQRQ